MEYLAPQTIDQLRSEIEALHMKIRAEEHRNQDVADELSKVKESSVEKSDNIQKVRLFNSLNKYVFQLLFLGNRQVKTVLRTLPITIIYGKVRQ